MLHSQAGPEPAGEHEQADFDDDQEADQQEVSKSANSCLLREIPKRNRKAGAFDDAPACLSYVLVVPEIWRADGKIEVVAGRAVYDGAAASP